MKFNSDNFEDLINKKGYFINLMICENCFSILSSLEEFYQILLDPYLNHNLNINHNLNNNVNSFDEIYSIENFLENYFKEILIEGGIDCEYCLYKNSIKKIKKFIYKIPSKIILAINEYTIYDNNDLDKKIFFKKYNEFEILNFNKFFFEENKEKDLNFNLKSTINYFEDENNQKHFIA